VKVSLTSQTVSPDHGHAGYYSAIRRRQPIAPRRARSCIIGRSHAGRPTSDLTAVHTLVDLRSSHALRSDIDRLGRSRQPCSPRSRAGRVLAVLLSDVDPEWVEGDVAYDIGRRVRHIAPAGAILPPI